MGEGSTGGGVTGKQKSEVCFLTSCIAAGNDNRSRIPVQTSPEIPQSHTHTHTEIHAVMFVGYRVFMSTGSPRGNIRCVLTL